MKILGFIPARSGSKGVKNKNIKPIKGIPLLEFSVFSAIESKKKGYLDEVLVSTDSPKYLDLLSHYDITEEYLRPSELSTDKSATIDSVIHALNWYKLKKNKTFDAVMILQPTSPFRTPEHISNAIQLLKNNRNCTCVASIKQLGDNHPRRIKRLDKNGKLIDFFSNYKEKEPSRRQDFLPKAYVRNGAIYLTKTKQIVDKKLIRGNHIIGLEMPESNSINIDDHFDFISASSALDYEEFKSQLRFFSKLTKLR